MLSFLCRAKSTERVLLMIEVISGGSDVTRLVGLGDAFSVLLPEEPWKCPRSCDSLNLRY